ncbi:hypothetical protein HU200_029015 [Digitaria exilis]|uniref:WRKY domain-containing protein n=1 Tax=Digitaria exilis TaxID=1010633 RepID=A0A835EPL3_9POAL|nr:hypothetical protein HU200_029015 [Digitaria exilis]
MEDQTRPLDGTISKIPGKLDRLLCHCPILPKGVEDEILLIKHDIEEILAILSNLEDDHAIMVRCWRKEARELSYDMEDFIDQYEHADPGSLTCSIPRRMITQRLKRRTTLYMLHEKLRRRLWMANKIREFSARVQELLQRHNLYNLGSIVGSTSRRCTGVRGQDKQEISRAYFNELVCRKMIQPVLTNHNGEVLSIVVHHMVLNLIVEYKSMEENFISVVHHSQANSTLADKVRRLSIHFGNAEDAIAPTNMRLSQVRTAYFGVFRCMPSIVQFRLLQVLILHFWGDEDSISLDLTRISELFRLRYLKVSSNVTLDLHTKFRGLPYLETLTIDARVREVPSDIFHLTGLLHLSLPMQTNLPNGIGRMTSLHTLQYFDLSTNMMENVHSLSMLTNLRELLLTCSTVQPGNLNNKMQFLLNSVLGRLSNLTSLNLVSQTSSYANSLDDADATRITISGGFSSVSTAPTLLQSLDVSPRICIFFCIPKWIGQLHKLCVLKIGVKKLVMGAVDVLKGLPALAVLSLYVQTKPASRIVIGKTGFLVIRYFKFNCCVPLLKFEKDAMPNLRKLKLVFNVHSSDQLTRIPIGINLLSELKEVSAKISGVGPDRSHRKAVELAFTEAIRVPARCQRVHVLCVENIIAHKEGQSSIAIIDEKDSNEHTCDQPALSNHQSSESIVRADEKQPSRASSLCSSTRRKVVLSNPDDDGYSWRKYFQKDVLGTKHPRSYYRCNYRHTKGCMATKQVQRTDADMLVFDVVDIGQHTCNKQAAQSADENKSTEAPLESANSQVSRMVSAEDMIASNIGNIEVFQDQEMVEPLNECQFESD